MDPSKGTSLWYEVGDSVALKKAVKILGEKSRRTQSAKSSEAKKGSPSSRRRKSYNEQNPSLQDGIVQSGPEAALKRAATHPQLSRETREPGTSNATEAVSVLHRHEGRQTGNQVASMPQDEDESIPSAAFLTGVFEDGLSSGSDSYGGT